MSETISVPMTAQRDIQTVTTEIRTLHRQAQGMILNYAIEIGWRLKEAKSLLEHGEWGEWLENEVDFSRSTANNFMFSRHRMPRSWRKLRHELQVKWEEAAWSRLAAYEDTGLTPAEVSAIVKEWSDLCTIVGECGGIDRLRELAEADKDGRLVVLPVLYVSVEQTEEIQGGDRGDGGFGNTGR